MGSSRPTMWSCGSRRLACLLVPARIHTTDHAFAGLGFWVCIFVFVFFSEGEEENIHIAFIFNTSADAFENVYATEFANIL